MRSFAVDADIKKAQTLPSWVYSDASVWDAQRERVFRTSWQLVADREKVKVPGQVYPFALLDGMLEVPLVLARDRDDRVHCMSNVCTHRGTCVVEHPGVETVLRCRYHGRRFGLDGRFQFMPEFDGVEGFPSPADDLAPVPWGEWGPFLFASLAPEAPLDRWLAPVAARCGWLPLAAAQLDAKRSRDYLVRANWALYVDNYLEGFHIPYVHAGLSGALDYGEYRCELFEGGTLQLGVASSDDAIFALPQGHPDHGQRIAAWYYWLFPNTMLNVYSWGISVNVVKPLAADRTRVSFLSYVWDPTTIDRGAGASLDRVEREDEAIVESIQAGMRSPLYERGRYSPARETGVHHFHRLLAARLA
jgi:choline monooxygenase